MSDSVQRVMDATETAYMRDAYGEDAWRSATRFLLAHHNEEEAAAILLSKHMRWADDSQGAGLGRKTNSAAFKRYYESAGSLPSGGGWDVEARQLVAMTFGEEL